MSESNEAILNQETIAAWEEYCRTGMSVPNDVVMAWLDSWGTENESSSPTSFCGNACADVSRT